MFDTKLKGLISNGESNYGNTIAANVSKILGDGLADASVTAFNAFKTALHREIEITGPQSRQDRDHERRLLGPRLYAVEG